MRHMRPDSNKQTKLSWQMLAFRPLRTGQPGSNLQRNQAIRAVARRRQVSFTNAWSSETRHARAHILLVISSPLSRQIPYSVHRWRAPFELLYAWNANHVFALRMTSSLACSMGLVCVVSFRSAFPVSVWTVSALGWVYVSWPMVMSFPVSVPCSSYSLGCLHRNSAPWRLHPCCLLEAWNSGRLGCWFHSYLVSTLKLVWCWSHDHLWKWFRRQINGFYSIR